MRHSRRSGSWRGNPARDHPPLPTQKHDWRAPEALRDPPPPWAEPPAKAVHRGGVVYERAMQQPRTYAKMVSATRRMTGRSRKYAIASGCNRADRVVPQDTRSTERHCPPEVSDTSSPPWPMPARRARDVRTARERATSDRAPRREIRTAVPAAAPACPAPARRILGIALAEFVLRGSTQLVQLSRRSPASSPDLALRRTAESISRGTPPCNASVPMNSEPGTPRPLYESCGSDCSRAALQAPPRRDWPWP